MICLSQCRMIVQPLGDGIIRILVFEDMCCCVFGVLHILKFFFTNSVIVNRIL